MCLSFHSEFFVQSDRAYESWLDVSWSKCMNKQGLMFLCWSVTTTLWHCMRDRHGCWNKQKSEIKFVHTISLEIFYQNICIYPQSLFRIEVSCPEMNYISILPLSSTIRPWYYFHWMTLLSFWIHAVCSDGFWPSAFLKRNNGCF